MQWRNTAEKYGIVGQTLHWLIVIGLMESYFIAEAAEDEQIGRLMGLHRSIGITILILASLRLLWRWVDRPPPWPATMASYQRVIARASHLIFYALLFALPITGWLLSSAEGDPVRYFDVFELPSLSARAGEETFEELHEALFNVLRSMLPGRGVPSR